MQRTIQPEILDSLPRDHPAALHNRRDIRLTNLLLGTHRWIERSLPPLVRGTDAVLEVGAGTGELGLRLARRGLAIHGLDLWPRPPEWPASYRWHREDLRTFAGYGDYNVILGNLIFHQFSDLELGELGAKLQHARMIIACEPQRRRSSQILYRSLAPLFGANHVSLHDAHVSIAAGFKGKELPEKLGLLSPHWRVRCTSTMLGIYRMVALREA